MPSTVPSRPATAVPTKWDTPSYYDLNVAGMAAHRELADSLGPEAWWHPTGHLRWADDPAAGAKLLETAALLASWDYRVEVCTGAEVRRRLEPALTVSDGTPVLFYPDEGWVDGRRLVASLVGRAVESGAEHRFGTEVCDVGIGADGSVKTVTLSDGSRLDVDVVVNAAGPNAARVAGVVGRHLPMRREAGVVSRLGCARVPIHRAMHTPQHRDAP